MAPKREKKEVDPWQLIEGLLDAFSDVECALENWASCGPEGMTKDEKKEFAAACRVRDKVSKALVKHGITAIATGSLRSPT